MTKIPYSREELFRVGPQRTFTDGQLNEIAFPLGGIGSGTISLGGRGDLRDFEIYNKPNKDYTIPFTFFALWAKEEGKDPVAKILEAKIPPPYRKGFGESQAQLQGVARFKDASFQGEYPVANLTLSDPDVPVTAKLTAWNPFIPLNVKDSALPVAILEWTITNPTDKPVDVSLAASMSNPVMKVNEKGEHIGKGSTNAFQKVGNLQGIFMTHPEADPTCVHTGNLALSTTWADTDVQTHWYRGGWWDGSHMFWDDFAEDGRLNQVLETAPGTGDVASMALRATVPAGGSVTLPVYITWYFPLISNEWPPPEDHPKALETYVTANFDNAWSVADYTAKNLDRLRDETGRWRESIYSNSLPDHLIEAITSQASIMRTCTCFLLKDETFFAWEGSGEKQGCCFGNCTHVWNYEQALAFLFPQLERTMRVTEFIYNTRDTGHMGFRTHLPLGTSIWDFKPCADGQMGTIIQVYRDWQLSGDDGFLKQIWPKVKLALEYAWTMTPEKMDKGTGDGVLNAPNAEKRSYDSLWDLDKDGVMEGEQHNTYDIEFFGPNTLCTAMYLGALKACAEIARYLGENDKADEYQAIYENGRKKVDKELWNGDYYIQQVEVIPEVTVPDILKSPESACGPTCECKKSPGGKVPSLGPDGVMPKYQYGDGCLSDQLLGQWAAHVAGIGYILDPMHVKKTMKSIFESNFRSPIDSFSNVQRVYALNDEAGLLLCSWPRGNRPALPFVYSDEVWTGIEFHVAAHLIYEGWVDEGLTIVKAVTERYRGDNRNPWDEIECGHHYARAMASWSVKLALDGFSYNLVEGKLGFAPKINADDYNTFWSTGTGWGIYTQKPCTFKLEVKYGEQKLNQLDLGSLCGDKVTVTGPNGTVSAKVEGKSVIFDAPVVLSAGQSIEISCK